jgi:hypothetical protein
MINIGEHCNGLLTGIEDYETKYFDGPEGGE